MLLDSCKLEGDAMTWCVSHALIDARVPHVCMCGLVRYQPTPSNRSPHYWIELPDDWIVDLRLRMWFEWVKDVPHGVFHPQLESAWLYAGQPIPPRRIGRGVLDIMTEGIIAQVKVPALGSMRNAQYIVNEKRGGNHEK